MPSSSKRSVKQAGVLGRQIGRRLHFNMHSQDGRLVVHLAPHGTPGFLASLNLKLDRDPDLLNAPL